MLASEIEAISLPGAELYYDENFLSSVKATTFFHALLEHCQWQRRNAPFGHRVPRDEAYYGDPGTEYIYSRRLYTPLPWIPALLQLKAMVEDATPFAAYRNSNPGQPGYNAVLCNLYRDGSDSVGWHADAEPEMGPVIASLSLGAPRLFRLKQTQGKLLFSKSMPHGSLLIMGGDTQRNFRHEVPKQPGITEPRINLTFRRVQHKT
jgi:alkylated DNA repair dioxygenase AlkB